MLSRIATTVASQMLAMLLVASTPVSAAPTRAQREQVTPVARLMTKAANLYRQKKFHESAEAVRQVQAFLDQLAADGNRDLIQLLRPVHNRLKSTHPLLEIEGYKLPPLGPLNVPIAPETPQTDGISFVNGVTPILMAKCGRCHVNRAAGMFSMESYAVMMRGPTDGKVVFPRDPVGSRIIEVIEEGDMPRGGGQVSPAELTTLKSWISEGARFDGPDPNANLASLAPDSSTQPVARLEVMPATGNETVSFGLDMAPVLVERCSGCHVNPPQQAEGQLNMTTFQQLLRGGESGPMINPGKPDQSLLVGKLKGTAGRRMPRDGDSLASDVIAKIETWILEGARFDGEEPSQQLRRTAAIAVAQASTHEQLSESRRQKALEYWRLGMPSVSAEQSETEDFLLLANLGADTLADFANRAEKLVPQIARLFQAPAGQPLVKGRMTLFFFRQQYDYSEFGKMVEQRKLPDDLRGHWQFNIVDAYAAIVPARDNETSHELALARNIASVYIASLAKDVPPWFAEGSGMVAVSRLGIDRVAVADWEHRMTSVLGGMGRTDDFQNDRLPPEDNDVASFGFVSFLMSDTRRHARLLDALRQGTPFARAFSVNYGGSPAQVADHWVRNQAR